MRKTTMFLTAGMTAFAMAADEQHVKLLSEPSSYVQDGLVGLYDGIRNDGIDKAHNNKSTVWKNLVGSNDLVFKHKAGATDDQKGYWRANAYQFLRMTSAETVSAMNLGQNFTIQLALNAEVWGDKWDGTRFDDQTQQSEKGFPQFFSDLNDHGFFMDRSSKSDKNVICWKHDGIAGTYANRANISWDGTYLTAMADAGTRYLFTTDHAANGATRTASGSYNTTLCVGGRSNSAQHYAHGAYYCVRFYNRALTDEELAHNRLVDEIRYHNFIKPEDTVSVVSSCEHASGFEQGVYAVSGDYVFTAPETVTAANGNVYRCTGYELAELNANGVTWARAGSLVPERSFAYAGGAGAPSVRIAWQWELEQGLEAYDAAAYVRDGLLLQLDGIENAGHHTHDPNATAWQNLASGERLPATQVVMDGVQYGHAGHWTDAGYAFLHGTYFKTAARYFDMKQCTMQVCADIDAARTSAGSSTSKDLAVDVPWPAVFGTGDFSDQYNFFLRRDGTSSFVNFHSGCNSIKTTVDVSKFASGRFRYGTFEWDAGKSGVSFTGDIPTSQTGAGTELRMWADNQPLYVGGVVNGGDDKKRNLRGLVHALRWYDRVLSASEQARNYEIDSVRYRGGDAANLVIASDRTGIAGNERLGSYRLAGTVSLTAPSEKTVDETTYACVGYRRETWDAVNHVWTGGVVSSERDVTVNAADGRQRVTWLWTVTSRLRPAAAAYDVDDYVTDGLVAQFDGIRNAGRTAAHADFADEWVDLSGNGFDAQMVLRAGLSVGWKDVTPGVWTASGYNQVGDALYFETERGFGLGGNVTIQVQTDVDTSRATQTASYPSVIGTSNDNGIFATSSAFNRLTWKSDLNNAGGRPYLDPWDGKPFTLLSNSDYMWMFSGGTISNRFTRHVDYKTKGYTNARWAIGNGLGGNSNARWLRGAIKSVRFYNRTLTTEEIARNNKVDEVRFHGRDMTNVTVVSQDGMSGVEADGAYVVTGSWTFRAKEVELDGKHRTANRYSVEKWVGGKWVVLSRGTGSEFAYAEADYDAPIRLTWRFAKAGFSITVR